MASEDQLAARVHALPSPATDAFAAEEALPSPNGNIKQGRR